jgi:hypothetical protein
MMPSPQSATHTEGATGPHTQPVWVAHTFEQPSPFSPLPSSQSSAAATRPSPHSEMHDDGAPKQAQQGNGQRAGHQHPDQPLLVHLAQGRPRTPLCQHDHEENQHRDGAGVDQDLNPRHELGL